MRCPICEQKMERWWIQHNKTWWTGEWNCDAHGKMKMSGVYKWGVLQERLHWIPSCSGCESTDDVIVIDNEYERWFCVRCGRSIELRNGRMIVTWQPVKVTDIHQPQQTMQSPGDTARKVIALPIGNN